MMYKVFLNELSLDGQFHDVEEFLDASLPLMQCLKFMKERCGQVNKISGFYQRKITKDKTWDALRGIRGDKALRMKSLLLSTTDQPPFWDLQSEWAQDISSEYIWNGQVVSGTSVAEAAEEKGILLSFPHREFNNVLLMVTKDQDEELAAYSAASLDHLSRGLWEMGGLDIYEYLETRYEGTRLNFSKFERQYGFQDFEKEEIMDCLRTFEKFISLEGWEEIFRDQGLRYKKYTPSSKEVNWFQGDEYQGKPIDKFRCLNPKRCYGYREENVFYVLRMERDHKISDNG